MLIPKPETLKRLNNINKLLETIYKQPIQLSDILKRNELEDKEITLLRDTHLDEYISTLLGQLQSTIGNFTKTRHYEILVSRFGLNDQPIPTLENLGNGFGISRERVRQLEIKALRRLRHPRAKTHIESTIVDLAKEILKLPPKANTISPQISLSPIP